jgi:lipoprotein NlpI
MPIPRFFFALLASATLSLNAAEPVEWPAWRAPIVAKFADDLTALDAALAQTPDSVSLHSRRGDCHLFLGHFAEAVADFEAMIALDPAEDAPHWRLGIAYYFAGEFAKSARQFEKYHAYDGRDRENGIWKFLAQAKAAGLEKARAEMLGYTQFDREPFPSLYEMFAGKRTPDEVLAEITRKGLDDDTQVAFFGNYYAGLGEAVLGRRERALELLGKAVALPQARAAGGPGYMWQVARLHWERLRAENAAK